MFKFRFSNALIVTISCFDLTMTTIDQIDRKILAIVQHCNLTSHREIANSVGLSAPAVTRRLKRLRNNGFIQSDVSVLNGKRLGRPLTIIVQVIADREQIHDLDAMRQAFAACPQVQHCYYITGEADFILIFNVSDMSEYQILTRTLFFESGHTKRFTTSVVMDTIKTNSHILL